MIPQDMRLPEVERLTGGEACSIRDLMVLYGASDEVLRDVDERDEILKRDPWRRDGLGFETIATMPDGCEVGVQTGKIDWSGTRFESK